MITLRNKFTWILMLGMSLLLAACGTLNVSVENEATREVVLEQSGPVEATPVVEQPNVISDPVAFEDALLQAIKERDATRLQGLMTDPLLIGTWRADRSEISSAGAVKELFNNQLQSESHLTVVKDVDLKALMAVEDPLGILGDHAGVRDAFLVSGWGKDGNDEAILFVAPQPDDSLRLHAWMVVQGGFSGARLGGVQHYNNVANGYSLYLPLGYEITTQPDNAEVFVAPGEGPTRGMAYIKIEPAYGRTVEQVFEDVKAGLGGDFNLSSTTLWIDYNQALVVTGLPGQDPNRQIFIVHNDTVYHMTFMPDDPQAGEGYQRAYQQMEDLYAMIVNTFDFIQ
jgi:hypothetical protein